MGKKKRGRGRPATDPANPRNVRVQVIVSERDVEAIDAKRGEASRSEWIYRIIRRVLGRK